MQVDLNKNPVTGFRSIRNQALLAYLAVEHQHAQSREFLTALLWPDHAPRQARTNLRQAIFQLRKALGDKDWIHADRRTVRLAMERHPVDDVDTEADVDAETSGDAAPLVTVDVLRFQDLLAACAAHPHSTRATCPACAQRLTDAVDLYRGDFLEGLNLDGAPEFDEWLLMQREQVRVQALDALFDLTAFHLHHRKWLQAILYAYRQINLDPLREEAYQQAIFALARNGQSPKALELLAQCRQRLADELGITPNAELQALAHAIRTGSMDSASAFAPKILPPQHHNLPAAINTVIGRESELVRLVDQLLDPRERLLTITGPGGAGKTALALEAARRARPGFPDGAYWVDLVGIAPHDSPPDDDSQPAMATAIAGVLGLLFNGRDDPTRQLVDYLQGRRLLLLLDSLDYLLDHAQWLTELLEQCTELTLLVTSRERLGLRSERVLPLGGLSLPDLGQNGNETGSYSSILLFVERAERLMNDFVLSDEDLGHVVEICRLVDGLPLGIELAATWVEYYTCAEIREAMQSDPDFLQMDWHDVPSRHRSLRQVFNYSWRLLNDEERDILCRLSLFRGEFSRDAAMTVAQAALEQIASLADKSLVQTLGPGRMRLHETVRQFAAEQRDLADPESVAAMHNRHATYYLRLVHGHLSALRGSEPQRAIAVLRSAVDNIQQAWLWAVGQDRQTELALALEPLARFYDLVGFSHQARHLFQEAAQALRPAGEPAAPLRARLLVEVAHALNALGRYTETPSMVDQALFLLDREQSPLETAGALLEAGRAQYRLGKSRHARELLLEASHLAEVGGDQRIAAEIDLALGDVHLLSDNEEAWSVITRALGTFRQIGDRRGEASALNMLGIVSSQQKRYRRGKEYVEAALAIHQALGDRRNAAIDLNNLGNFAALLNDYPQSDDYLRHSIVQAKEIGYRTGVVNGLCNLGMNAMEQDDREQAERYFREALPQAKEIGFSRAEVAIVANLGALAWAQRKYGTARDHWQRAADLAHENGDRFAETHHLHNLGRVHTARGRYAKAESTLRQGLYIAQETGRQDQEIDILLALGRLCLAMDALADAEAILQQAVSLAREETDGWRMAGGLALLAMAATRRQAWPQARQAAHNALTFLQGEDKEQHTPQRDPAVVQGMARTALGLCAQAEGQHTAALEALEEAVMLLRDSKSPPAALEPLALLAAGDPAAAGTHVAAMFALLGEGSPDFGLTDPFRVYGLLIEQPASADHPRRERLAADVRHRLAMLLLELAPPRRSVLIAYPPAAALLDGIPA